MNPKTHKALKEVSAALITAAGSARLHEPHLETQLKNIYTQIQALVESGNINPAAQLVCLRCKGKTQTLTKTFDGPTKLVDCWVCDATGFTQLCWKCEGTIKYIDIETSSGQDREYDCYDCNHTGHIPHYKIKSLG